MQYTWLPASSPNPKDIIKVVKAQGSHIILDNGNVIYDAISSWWCKPMGHRHPLMQEALIEQLAKYEHHIAANTYNDNIEELSYKLTNKFQNPYKVMYASDGSSAIEIAMKLSYETRLLTNEPNRNKFLALNNSYHGETIFTLSVCGLDNYKKNYKPFLADNYFINNIPYVNFTSDLLWLDCRDAFKDIEKYLDSIKTNITALLIEPVVQGAAGLKIISKDFLIKLLNWAKNNNIHIISDEIMVGLGRLGFFCVTKELLELEADFICFAKNLTAGIIPMSAVLIKNSIFETFKIKNKLFAHSHTHSCNSLAASVANKYLSYLEENNLNKVVFDSEIKIRQMLESLINKYSFIKNIRAIGSIAAFDINLTNNIENIFLLGIKHGIYIRPIGNSLYIMPPIYNLKHDLIEIENKLINILDDFSI